MFALHYIFVCEMQDYQYKLSRRWTLILKVMGPGRVKAAADCCFTRICGTVICSMGVFL